MVFIVHIGGDPDQPSGWLTPEEYAEHYGDPADRDDFRRQTDLRGSENQ